MKLIPALDVKINLILNQVNIGVLIFFLLFLGCLFVLDKQIGHYKLVLKLELYCLSSWVVLS